MKIGMGYDVHKFDKERKLILGGIEIPYEYGLLGHSDADVLLHAIGDAFNRDEEDYSLTVASAGIGEPLKLVRQYKKLVGESVEVLLKSGVKILATLEEVTEEAITISYEEAVVVEGKKKKQLQRTTHTYSFEEIKWTKEYLDYK